MDKDEIVRILEEIATLLELKNENPFKVRAYRNAARSLLNMGEDLKKVIREGKLTDYEGIGESLAEKIELLALKGKLPFYDKLKKSIPQALLELMQLQGLGPKRVQLLYKKLKVKTLDELKQAAEQGKLAKLKGFGPKTQKNILDAIENRSRFQARHLYWDAIALAEPLLAELKRQKGVQAADICGSLRRKMETIGDLDFLVGADQPKAVMKWFTTHSQVKKVIASGETKASVVLEGGIAADLRVVSMDQYGFALSYFTGSKEHTIEIRKRYLKQGWSLSEYGALPTKKGVRLPFKGKRVEEKDIYEAIGLSYIPPELREHTGEFDEKIPRLIEEKDLRGSFHTHTTASDGRSTLQEMIAAADKLGWEYIGISDHSKSAFQANGLSEEKILAQIRDIKKINASRRYHTHVFAGVECDILPNGKLDFSDHVLDQFDFVIASVHSSFRQDEKTMTKRIIRAIEHPATTILGHVTGRLLLERSGYSVNLEKVIDACIANQTVMELNAQPLRLDMDWRYWHKASERGLLAAIDTDAHAADQLLFLTAGVNIARKGWLEKKHVINTRTLSDIKKFLSL